MPNVGNPAQNIWRYWQPLVNIWKYVEILATIDEICGNLSKYWRTFIKPKYWQYSKIFTIQIFENLSKYWQSLSQASYRAVQLRAWNFLSGFFHIYYQTVRPASLAKYATWGKSKAGKLVLGEWTNLDWSSCPRNNCKVETAQMFARKCNFPPSSTIS